MEKGTVVLQKTKNSYNVARTAAGMTAEPEHIRGFSAVSG